MPTKIRNRFDNWFTGTSHGFWYQYRHLSQTAVADQEAQVQEEI